MNERLARALSRTVSAARTMFVTLGAVVVGVAKMATHRSEPTAALKPGDVAPDFTLPGSDGRTYRLADFRGRKPVVLAWFPKAFTGG